MGTAQIPLTTAIATERRIFEEAARRILILEKQVAALQAENNMLRENRDTSKDVTILDPGREY